MKAGRGKTKTRLEPDGVRGETVTQIALWRYHEGLGYDTIADRLNADLANYPPPEPPGKERARGAWSKTSVYEILQNPKYTGYQVFNRRASRSRSGKVNDPVKWVWSPEPVHEPLIPKWMYDELAARRTYVLRGMVVHGCGRRMYGNHRHNSGYYKCHPMSNNRGRPYKYAGHERAAYIREDAILEAVSAFYADRVFGSHRRDLLISRPSMTARPGSETPNESACSALSPISPAGRTTSCAKPKTAHPTTHSPNGLRQTYNELEAGRRATLAAIAELDSADQAAPTRPTADDAGAARRLALPHAQPARRTRTTPPWPVRGHQPRCPAAPDSDDVTISIGAPPTTYPTSPTPQKGSPTPCPPHKNCLIRPLVLVRMLCVPPVRFERTLDGF